MIKAILYKDFKNIFKNKDLEEILKILVMASIIFLGLIVFSSKVIGYYQMLGMISIFCIVMFALVFEIDEKSNSIDFLKTTPKGSRNIVRARLILNIIIFGYSLVINLMAIGIIRIMNIKIDELININHVLMIYLIMLTYSQILSTFIYKFGLSRAMTVIIAALFILILLLVILFKFIKINPYRVENLISKLNIPLTITLVCLFIIFIMYKLSVRIVKYQ